jgi:hypothetical protein
VSLDAPWEIEDPEFAWRLWRLMEGLDWNFLPYAGGLLDQPNWVIEMLLTVNWRKHLYEDLLKSGHVPDTTKVMQRPKRAKGAPKEGSNAPPLRSSNQTASLQGDDT